MVIDSLGGYRKYLGNMFRNISRMVSHVPNDLMPDSLASFFIIHVASFKKKVFLKDSGPFLKGQESFRNMPLNNTQFHHVDTRVGIAYHQGLNKAQ